MKNGSYSSKYSSKHIYFCDSNGDVYLKVDKNYYKSLSI